ncbi:MAG: PAS domain S-box protein, partial [Bacteroidota bacterium]|nr:PAS domain S-box protein [Bacteroidota bacterium]
SLNLAYNRSQKSAEQKYNHSRSLLSELRTEMVKMSIQQNSYLILPNTRDSLGFVSAGQAAKKTIFLLDSSSDDSLFKPSDINQLHILLDKNLSLSAVYLRQDVLRGNTNAAIYSIKEKFDTLREKFYLQLDNLLLKSRINYQNSHDTKDNLYHDKIEALVLGTGTIILLIIYLVYLIYQQIGLKTRIQKRFQIFENAGDGLLATDADFRVNYVNRKTGELLKIETDKIIGTTLWELIPSLGSRKIHEIFYLSVIQQEYRFIESYYEPTKAWFRIGIYPFENGLSLTIKDITDLKLSESALNKSRKLYAFISRVNDLVLHAKSADELYPAICQIALDSGDFLFAWVGKADESGEFMKPFCSAGNGIDYLKGIVIALTDKPEGQGPSGKAFRLGKYYYCNDIAHDPAMKPWKDSAIARGFRSSIALPIKLDTVVVAVITLYAPEPYFFTDEQLQLLERVLENVSFAITALESERKRQEVEQKLQIVNRAIEQSHASIVITNAKGEIQYVNPAFTQLTGYTMEEVLGQNPRVLKTGYTSDDAYSGLWKEISEGRIWQGEFLNKKKNGETYWESATISPILTKEGTITHYVAVKENITERKKLEEKEKQLLRMFENTSAFMGTCDMKMNFIYGNQSLRNVLEIGDEDITMHNVNDFRPIGGKEYMQEVYDSLFLKGKWLGENKYVSKSGKEIPVMQVIMLHQDAQGIPDYISTTAIDLTKMKEAEQELLRLNTELRNFTHHLQYVRETEKNTLAKEIHDKLGQGLASLKLNTSWIKKHLDDGKTATETRLDTLLESISKNLVDFNKIYIAANTSMIDEIGLHASIQYQAELFEKNHLIPVTVHSNMEQVRIQTDLGLNLYRILLECLSNIQQHANASLITISLNLAGELLELSVQDNGKGFDYSQVDSTKYHGLIDIRERVLAIQGKLIVQSEINKGTCITIQVNINSRNDFSI